MKKGIIFDIKKYAVHDGPGIRTTIFFKGCPLNCWWCHNPEGIPPERALLFRESQCLPACRACIDACPQHALVPMGPSLQIIKEKCTLSENCVNTCPTEALQMAGKEFSASDLMIEIEKDRIFYEQSQGGVTFSGGEPLMQPEFLRQMLEICQERNIHTIVDTSGYTRWKNLDSISPYVNLFFYDLKIMDDQKHRQMTGVSNKIILENLRGLTEKGQQVEIRLPVISGFNDTEENRAQTTNFLLSLPGIKQISLLPYHKLGTQKYIHLNKDNPMPDIQPPSQEFMQQLQDKYLASGFQVNLGG